MIQSVHTYIYTIILSNQTHKNLKNNLPFCSRFNQILTNTKLTSFKIKIHTSATRLSNWRKKNSAYQIEYIFNVLFDVKVHVEKKKKYPIKKKVIYYITRTWESLRPSFSASFFLSGLLIYFWSWKRRSRPLLWVSLKTARLIIPRRGFPRAPAHGNPPPPTAAPHPPPPPPTPPTAK